MSRRKSKCKENKQLQSRFVGEIGFVRESKSKLIESPQGMKKLSECILEVIEPYSQKYPDELKTVIQMGIIAWNLSFLPENGKVDSTEIVFSASASLKLGVNPPIVKLYLNDLKKRKTNMFPEDKRLIVDYEIIENSSGITFNVASALDKETAAK